MFEGPERLVGRMVRVVVEDASAVALFGRVETSERDSDSGVKGITYDGRLARGPGELLDCVGWDRRAPRSASRVRWRAGFPRTVQSCRPGADPRSIADWEERHGYQLPHGLQAWLRLSNGLFGGGPLHPSDHGDRPDDPVRPRARDDRAARELVRAGQSRTSRPSASTWPTACRAAAIRSSLPATTNRAARRGSSPGASRSGSSSCCGSEGREYWFDPGFRDFGDPWQSHRRHVAQPPLARPAAVFADRVAGLHAAGADERKIAASLGLCRCRRRVDLPSSSALEPRSRFFAGFRHMTGKPLLMQLDV